MSDSMLDSTEGEKNPHSTFIIIIIFLEELQTEWCIR